MKASLVYKKLSQIWRLTGRFWVMRGAVFTILVVLFGFVPYFMSWGNDSTQQEPLVEVDPKGTDPKGTEPKETEPKETEPKETEPKETEPKGADLRRLEEYAIIPEKDPFKLIKPEPEKKEEPKVEPPKPRGIPQLSGISTLRGSGIETDRALLRISPLSGGPAQYVFLRVGERAEGVEVIKVDVEKGMVEVLVRGQTIPLELDKQKSMLESGAEKASARGTGSNYTPQFGSYKKETLKPSSSSTSVAEKNKGGKESRPTSSVPRAGELKKVPTRNRVQPSLELIKPFGAGFYEKPAFDAYLQLHVIDPADLSIQREIIRGQYSRETPTDLPVDKR